jgi:uncharacterized protein YprB with RNaseH-like and TPR domain
MRFAIFDIESTKLKSDQGFLLCAGFRDYASGAKKILRLGDVRWGRAGRDRLLIDQHLAVAIRTELEAYDGIITWNGKMFDIPFLNDRLMFCGERRVRPLFHLDPMYQARQGRAAMTSSRLDWVAKSLGCPMLKTPLIMNTWTLAEAEAIAHFRYGRSNFDSIIEHNDADLDVTAWVYDKLKNRIQTISKG